jgi:hypothetical protein
MHNRRLKLINEYGQKFHFELRNYPKHVAYLFESSKLIAVSINQWGKHAEVGLLPYLRRDRQQSVYVKRISEVNTMSRPCMRCFASMRHISPKVRIYFTNEHGEWIEEDEVGSNHRSRSDKGQPTVHVRMRKHRKIV